MISNLPLVSLYVYQQSLGSPGKIYNLQFQSCRIHDNELEVFVLDDGTVVALIYHFNRAGYVTTSWKCSC